MTLVVDGPHTLWADCGGGNGRKNVAVLAKMASVALSYKISEGAGYIDANGQYHHDAAVDAGMFPIPYVFPLPAACGMSVTDQAKRDANLIHAQHGSFNGIGVMLDLEHEPGSPGWGPFQLSAGDATLYVETIRALTGMKVGGYTGAGYAYNGREGFDWRVVPNYSYTGAPTDLTSILTRLNGGVTWMPPGGAFRQFTDAVDVAGSPTDFNVAPLAPADFLAVVGGTHNSPNVTGGLKVSDFPTIGGRDPSSVAFKTALTHQDNVQVARALLQLARAMDKPQSGAWNQYDAGAVEWFQQQKGLAQDGVIGDATWAALAHVRASA